jgi:hypothetical protein
MRAEDREIRHMIPTRAPKDALYLLFDLSDDGCSLFWIDCLRKLEVVALVDRLYKHGHCCPHDADAEAGLSSAFLLLSNETTKQ